MTSPRWPDGYGRVDFAEIDSTNDEARRLAAAGTLGPIWIRGGLQTRGRGRRGRSWDSPTGNLFATLLIRPEVPPSDAALLTFAAALAVADVLDAFVDPSRVKLKWPNDVQLDGKKVCGTLLESSARSNGLVDWLAIGIGVNLASHPHLVEPPTISLAEAMQDTAPLPEDALTYLAAGFARWYAAWQGEGFLPLRQAWLARARGLGEAITVNLPNETLKGRMGGIDETGALLLETEGTTRKVSAGEVFFGS